MTYTAYSLFYPDPDFLTKHGYGRVARVPCVFDQNWTYSRESSWYLRDRSKGLVDTSFNWAISQTQFDAANNRNGAYTEASRLFGSAQAGKLPTDASLETIGRRHINFLEWCEWNRRYVLKGRAKPTEPAWTCVTFDDLTESYVAQMRSGTWGSHSLAPSTIDSRVDEACYFLHWAAEHGLRSPFYVDVYIRSKQRGGNRSDSHRTTAVASRTKRTRRNPIDITMPRPKDLDQWLKCLEIEKGYTKGLMARLMKVSAIRREECAQWRIWTLPEKRSDWRKTVGGRYVTITIEHGAKGGKFINERGDEVGPARAINIPIEMAEEIHHYREFLRPKARSKYIKSGKTPEEQRRRMKENEQRLFLSEHTGTPISGRVLYKAWTATSFKPAKEWHPQLMRHYWAVTTLWNERCNAIKVLQQHKERVIVTGDWISGMVLSDIETLIRPQLGHISKQTTQGYLVWIRQMYDASEQHDRWVAHLEIGEQDLEPKPG